MRCFDFVVVLIRLPALEFSSVDPPQLSCYGPLLITILWHGLATSLSIQTHYVAEGVANVEITPNPRWDCGVITWRAAGTDGAKPEGHRSQRRSIKAAQNGDRQACLAMMQKTKVTRAERAPTVGPLDR